ncbi:MAG: polysaccharide biosynthesis protein [Flavobacteriaceae bacterium]|nr:polysaccharide biosynthesis protein [Flavobacteriaceae bacterium]
MSIIKQTIFSTKEFISNFFTKGHERTLLAKKNIAASFGIKAISIAINLALVPLTINYVNPTQYGIWLTLSSIVAWFSFFDIGFGHGLRNRFAEAKANGDFEKARIYVSTTYAVLTLIFLGVWLLFFVVNFFVDWSKILNAPQELAQELSTLALIVFSFFCLQIVLKTINTVIIADQKPAKAAFFDMLGQLIALVTIFILTKTTQGSLIYLGLGLGSAPIIMLMVSSFVFYTKPYKYFAPSLKFVQFTYAKDILGLGIKFFVIQFSAIFFMQSTNIIISQILSSEQVTVYNIAYKYFFVVTTIANIISMPFWSSFTEAYVKKDFIWMKNIASKFNHFWFFIIPILICMLYFSSIFYRFWIGDAVEVPFAISGLMSILVLINIRFNLYVILLNGIGKIRLQLNLYLLSSFIYIPLAIIFGHKYKLNGIIIANIIVYLIFALVIPYQLNLILKKKAKGIWNK